MTKPNWCKWVLMPEVKVWEACVLSIGLEPKTMEFERESWMYAEGTGPHITSESFPSRESEQKYKDLVDVLAANLLVREHFSPAAMTTRGKGYCGVRLDEFVRWATLKVKWLDLPPELAGLVKDKSNGNLPAINDASRSNMNLAGNEKKTPQIRDKGLQQIEAIVAELERLGYKPLCLPALVAGQRSAKAEVVDNLDGNGLFTARKAFENAWQEATRRSYIKIEN
jgi:hypothetical protein